MNGCIMVARGLIRCLAGMMCEASGKELELDPANAGGSQYMMRNGGAGRSVQPNM